MDSSLLQYNLSLSVDYEEESTYGYYDIQEIVINSVLLYIGLCTNIYMLWSLYKTWEKGSRAGFYLVALCIAETVGLCVYCSMEIGIRVTVNWTAGNVGCKIFMVLQNFGTYLSHFILVGFNLDNAITLLRGRASRIVRLVFLVLAFVCTLALTVPNAFYYEAGDVVYYRPLFYCFSVHPAFPHLTLLVAAGLPMILVVLFGGPTLCIWCAKRGSISNTVDKEDEDNADVRDIGQEVGLVCVLNIVFIICWLPYLLLINSIFSSDLVAYLICGTLATANSCINPLVYAVFKCLGRRQNKVSPAL